MDTIRIVPTAEQLITDFHRCVDVVARERRYLGFSEGPPLEVFASNERAIDLYRRLGFVTEGVKHRARQLDGRYDDNVLMALMRVEADGLRGGM